jgi:hypothetical protein
MSLGWGCFLLLAGCAIARDATNRAMVDARHVGCGRAADLIARKVTDLKSLSGAVATGLFGRSVACTHAHGAPFVQA